MLLHTSNPLNLPIPGQPTLSFRILKSIRRSAYVIFGSIGKRLKTHSWLLAVLMETSSGESFGWKTFKTFFSQRLWPFRGGRNWNCLPKTSLWSQHFGDRKSELAKYFLKKTMSDIMPYWQTWNSSKRNFFYIEHWMWRQRKRYSMPALLVETIQNWLLSDEPTSSLDWWACSAVVELLKSSAGNRWWSVNSHSWSASESSFQNLWSYCHMNLVKSVSWKYLTFRPTLHLVSTSCF